MYNIPIELQVMRFKCYIYCFYNRKTPTKQQKLHWLTFEPWPVEVFHHFEYRTFSHGQGSSCFKVTHLLFPPDVRILPEGQTSDVDKPRFQYSSAESENKPGAKWIPSLVNLLQLDAAELWFNAARPSGFRWSSGSCSSVWLAAGAC